MNPQTEEKEHLKCKCCKCWVLKTGFINDKGRLLKSCYKCRERQRLNREKSKNKFQCDKCDYKCFLNSNLKQHIKMVHDKIKDFECPQCDFKCSNNGNLKQHTKRVHDKIKDIECPQCDYKCFSNGHLTKHIKAVHDKIKDFQCDKCDFKCSNNSDLKRHIKTVHDKIKDFECPQCDYKCSNNSNLKQHIKTVHDKIKDFECPQCDYKCSQISNFNRHVKHCTSGRVGSSGEVKIKETLESMNIEYQYNTSYKVKDKNLLQWDFILTEYDTPIFIEYDGRQHFKPTTFGGISKERAIENFEKQKRHDEIKNNFCKENDYLLLRIKYTEFGDIPRILTKFIVDNTDWGDETESE